MKRTKVWEIGGFVSGAVLIVFGVIAIVLGVSGYQTVQDELDKEYIVGGDRRPSTPRSAARAQRVPAREPDRTPLPFQL